MFSEIPLREFTPADLKMITQAIDENEVREADLPQSIHSAPSFRDKRRLQQIDDWRINIKQIKKGKIEAAFDTQEQSADAAGINRTRQNPGAQHLSGQYTTSDEVSISRIEEAEKEFRNFLPDLIVPPGMRFVPFLRSKIFTAAECHEYPMQDTWQTNLVNM